MPINKDRLLKDALCWIDIFLRTSDLPKDSHFMIEAGKLLKRAESEKIDNQAQYNYLIIESGSVIDRKATDDPFITAKIKPHGWRVLWLLLTGRLEYVVKVSGTQAAHNVVFTGDYSEPESNIVRLYGGHQNTAAEKV